MRRMYSEKELTTIINQVVGEYIEDGALDETINDAVLAYIAEHPIDPTAITGLDIAPKDVSASGNITGASIIENMSGYSFTKASDIEWTAVYVSACKNGNKLSFIVFGSYTKASEDSRSPGLGSFTIPTDVGSKLIPFSIAGTGTDRLDIRKISFFSTQYNSVDVPMRVTKVSNASIRFAISDNDLLTAGTTYLFRYEVTFLLSENLVA